jgi:hypothetical protein
MRRAWQRLLIAAGVLYTAVMLFFALVRGFLPGYLLAFVGMIFIAAALVNLKRLRRE